jgi:hypothetical protein
LPDACMQPVMDKMLDYKTCFAFLDDFWENSKEDGKDATYMFGAPAHLVAFYGITNVEAMEVTYAWMKTFDENKALDERVAIAEASRPTA